MAVTLDQNLGTGNSSGTLTTTLTTTAAVASGGRLVVVVARFAGSPGSTITFTGTGGLTWAKDHEVTSGNIKSAQFSAPAASGLAISTALTITHANNCDCIMAASSYLGIDTSAPVSAFNGAGASTAAWSTGSVAGTAGDALIGGCFVDNATSTSSSPGGGATERVDRNIGAQSETLVYQDLLSIGGSTALTGTWNAAGTHVAIAVAYKPAAGGVVTVKKLAALGVG